MKDITHYFADLPKNSENASVPSKEVRSERAKIQDSEDISVISEVSRAKRKRGRVKIKISRKSSEGTVCDILESSTDLVDKTPSPYPKPKRRQIDNAQDTPKGKTLSKSDLTVKDKGCKLQTDDQSKNGLHVKAKSQSNKSTSNKDNKSTLKEAQTKDIDQKMENKPDKKVLDKKIENNKEKHTEKLIELANKKGYTKRKMLEDEESAKIEKRLEKRKKMFTIEPNKNSEMNQSDENCPKNDDLSNIKRSSNLLNYFSKATPEQLENERLKKTKVTTKAEVHTPQNLSLTTTNNNSFSKQKDVSKKKGKSNLKDSPIQFDEICLIQSETLTLSPKTDKLKSPVQVQNKPKWSLKIQLQSNMNSNTTGITDEDDIYTPTASSKSLKESSDKIPKVLLPMKNKKTDLNNSSLDGCTQKNKKEERKSLKTNNEEVTKTENVKTEINEKLKNSTPKQNETNNISSEQKNNDDECLIIEDDSLKKKSKEKLAPLFTKKVKPSPETIAARRLFLQSDIQENDKSNEKRKPVVVEPAILPFPKISHITQTSLTNTIIDQRCRFKLKKESKFEPLFDLSYFKTILKPINNMHSSENSYKCLKSDIETTLGEIQSFCSDTSSLWNYVSKLLKPETSKRTPKTRRKSDKKKSKQPCETLPNEILNNLWTDKYKPNSTEEVVGNEDAALKLKSWLDSWKFSKNNDDYSSSEEFYVSDSSSSSNVEQNQVAVLVGPHGSGKTATVYAIAQELGYKVLEVNASSKRPGKKILKDFEEATKSHRVKKSDLKDTFISVLKKSDETTKISQNSLIFMEDVDLIFEEDEGFISATFQLASNTKRPIVMTLRDTCSHLSKMAPQQFRIDFQPVAGKRVSALLQLIALAETGCKIPQSCADTLCENGDLRRALLHLQYLLLSGKENISLHSLTFNNLTWKDMRTYLYKPAIKAEKNRKKKEKSDNKTINDNILNNLANSLDNFTLLSTFINIEDPTSHLYCLNSEPSMSLIENTNSYSSLESTNLEIGNWLSDAVQTLFLNDFKKLSNQIDTSNNQLLTKKQINHGVDLALSQIASYTLDRRALAVDYLSNIRTICRAEEVRNQLNSKRGNRFFHYLQSSKLSSGSAKSGNILSAACKMLQEKSTASSET